MPTKIDQPAPNPYESPQAVLPEAFTKAISPLTRGLVRVTLLGFAGFGLFLTIGVLFVVVAETFQLEIFPSIGWAFEIGVLGGGLFLASEIFNSGKGHTAGFIIRFVAAIVVFLLSGIMASVLVPPQHHSYGETDPAWPQRLVVLVAIVIPALAIARLLWLGNRDLSHS